MNGGHADHVREGVQISAVWQFLGMNCHVMQLELGMNK